MQIFFLNGLWRFLKNGHLPVKLYSSAPPPAGMQSRKTMACGESWKSSLYLLARDLFLKVLECLCKNFSDINLIIYEKVDFRLILTILIFLFAVPKPATQLLH